MEIKRYCTICGRRIVPLQGTMTYQTEDGGMWSVSCYISDSAEPICFGHDTALAVHAERHKGTDAPSWEELTNKYKRVAIPQAFQDAFSDEELQP